jgi:drug/metabolite transporter (DMT)-like permease
VSSFTFGIGTVLSKAALDTGIPEVPLLTVQLAASVAVLGGLAALRGDLPARRWSSTRLGAAGLLEPGGSYLAGIAGLALTTAGSASVIGSVEPVLTAVLAWILLRERVSARAAAMMTVALLGVLLVTVSGGGTRPSSALTGDALVLLGVVFAALYALSSARTVQRVSPLTLTLLQHAWALVLFAALQIIGLTAGLVWAVPPTVEPAAWLLAVASGVVHYALPFWLYLVAVRTLPVGLAAQFLAIIPVVGVTGGVLLLGEHFTAVQAVGVLLIVTALGGGAGRNSEDGDVQGRVGADEGGGRAAAVGEHDADLATASGDVGVGEDVAAVVEDEAGAGARATGAAYLYRDDAG